MGENGSALKPSSAEDGQAATPMGDSVEDFSQLLRGELSDIISPRRAELQFSAVLKARRAVAGGSSHSVPVDEACGVAAPGTAQHACRVHVRSRRWVAKYRGSWARVSAPGPSLRAWQISTMEGLLLLSRR